MSFTTTEAQPDSVSQAIARLRSCTQVNIQSGWSGWSDPLYVTTHPTTPNAKGHIAWSRGKMLRLEQRVVVPQHLNGYPLSGLCLRLALTWWAELAQIYVNGQLVQEGDLFDCSTRVLLSQAVTPNEEFTIALHLVSPAHDEGALVRSLLVYESTSDEFLEPGFVADELAVMQGYLKTQAPEKLPDIAASVASIDWSALPDRQKFDLSLLKLRQNLIQSEIQYPKSKIFLVGHAHLDLAWLWAVSETWQAAQRTFTSVLNLQQEFPELTFCHSTPALYAWIEQHRPDLFTAIQQQVKAGRWEIVGGLWVEPELNTISGESIVRQLLYGQRYVQQKFGSISKVAWLPDSFGFCATLPQFLANAGIEYFVTQKLRWNDTTEFPYGAFWWRSPDGTELFSLMSAPIGEGIDPLKMASYICEWETQTLLQQALWLPGVGDHGGGPSRDMLEVARRWQQSPFFPLLEFTTTQEYLHSISTQELRAEEQRSRGAEEQGSRGEILIPNPKSVLESLANRSAVRIFPKLRQLRGPKPTPPTFRKIQNSSSPQPLASSPYSSSHQPLATSHFPIWQDELYLEFHRGCYTTHGRQKRWNRRTEGLLYQAELWASMSWLSTGKVYPQAELEVAWKKVLFNQFHDILPGSAIADVYVDANRAWTEAEQTATNILQQSLSAIASQILLPPPPDGQVQPIVVFNSLNWERVEVVEILLPHTNESISFLVYDSDSIELPSQTRIIPTFSNEATVSVSFLAKIPACGYRVFWLCPCSTTVQTTTEIPLQFVLENEYLRVTVDQKTGDLSSVFDKSNEREVLSGAGNQLQAFQDKGQYWDAWNIDPNYAQHPLPPAELLDIQQEYGSRRSPIRVVRKIGQSTFWQDYILEPSSTVLKIKTTVDWQESHVLVKAAFPLNLESDYATYEIPCGSIKRSTQPQTPAEKAKWEVPALHWADISTDEYGVSLLNDCKYGYDSQPNQLRITLLRSSNWPDPDADRGWHEFIYALYPHGGNWQASQTVRRGYELNQPLQVMRLTTNTGCGKMPAKSSLLDLSSENLILMAFKQSEDDPQQFILRCYESVGETAELVLQSDLGLSIAQSVDLLEQRHEDTLGGDRTVAQSDQMSPTAKTPIPKPCTIAAWKIATFQVTKCE